ncbi:MAG TPA: [protein-PII] uridylyltransferase, partial [Paracoccaceae bacterium]|nr:[protein-PII] uridylyltransferase [Paracoccaceae bacterium]
MMDKPTKNEPCNLMDARDQIIDKKALLQALETSIFDAKDAADIKARTVAILKVQLKAGRELIGSAVLENPDCAQSARRAYTYLTDQVVQLVYLVAERWLHPRPNPTAAERLCVMAVGGYGRAEMAPFSDVDLLFLTPYKQTPWGESMIESILYTLWDLRMKVGHATRTVDDCIRLGKGDYTIRTALLENRYLAGEEPLAKQLESRLWAELFANTGADFVEAKLDERDKRHNRTGGSRYMVEPNVKEGKGGLRDLQTLFWIAKYLYHADTPADLVKQGVFRQDEFDNFLAAEAFLWKTRIVLHLVTNRPTEQLTFDTQVEVARALGYKDSHGRRDVEFFMQDYFRHATHVGDLTRIFL